MVQEARKLSLTSFPDERSTFTLTLDNGLHCVTTAPLELSHNAPIGQEFELVVFNDLEFQLTLQTKLSKPPEPPMPRFDALPITSAPPSPSKKAGHMSTFSRVFGSPKKKRELERQAAEEEARIARIHQQQAQERAMAAAAAQRARANPTSWDLLHNLVASDGSFARAYIALSNHESDCFGRALTTIVPCYNEWALETDSYGNASIKSKRGGQQRKPPHRVGSLELQLMYIPRPKGSPEDVMPRSLNAALRELREAENTKEVHWEGALSQQGGDCPYWRRRHFKLVGPKLTAYHETTRQPRATINLSKAAKLIHERISLTEPTISKTGGRRKSAFAEEEEGYMFVEEGFRIRFANGETIDFYADTTAVKEDALKALSQVVGKSDVVSQLKGRWTGLVLAREAQLTAAGKPVRLRDDESTKRESKRESKRMSQMISDRESKRMSQMIPDGVFPERGSSRDSRLLDPAVLQQVPGKKSSLLDMATEDAQRLDRVPSRSGPNSPAKCSRTHRRPESTVEEEPSMVPSTSEKAVAASRHQASQSVEAAMQRAHDSMAERRRYHHHAQSRSVDLSMMTGGAGTSRSKSDRGGLCGMKGANEGGEGRTRTGGGPEYNEKKEKRKGIRSMLF